MKYNVITTKILKTDNDKEFKIGWEIAFSLFNAETNHHDRYIGEITEITDTTITISRIEINGYQVGGEKIICLADIESNSCGYVYYD